MNPRLAVTVAMVMTVVLTVLVIGSGAGPSPSFAPDMGEPQWRREIAAVEAAGRAGPPAGDEPSRVVLPDGSGLAVVTGRLVLASRPDRVSMTLDGARQIAVDYGSGAFVVPSVEPGTHRLTAVAVTDRMATVYTTIFDKEAGRASSLPALEPHRARPGLLGVDAVHARSGIAFSATEMLRSGLLTRRADIDIDGCLFFVPIGVDIPVLGLPDEGMDCVVRGAPPTVLMDRSTMKLHREHGSGRLLPASRCGLQLEFVDQAALVLQIAWSPAADVDVDVHVEGTQWGEAVRTSCRGRGSSRARIMLPVGWHQIEIVGKTHGVVSGYQALQIELGSGGGQLDVELSPVERVDCRLGPELAHMPVRVATAELPEVAFWQGKSDAQGAFVLNWAPLDLPLVVQVGSASPRPATLRRAGECLLLGLE
jgi:hypothetical protein